MLAICSRTSLYTSDRIFLSGVSLWTTILLNQSVVFLNCSSFQLIVIKCQWTSRGMILSLPRGTTSYYPKLGHKPHDMWPPDWRDQKRYDPQIQHVCRWASRCMTPKLPTDFPRISPRDSTDLNRHVSKITNKPHQVCPQSFDWPYKVRNLLRYRTR